MGFILAHAIEAKEFRIFPFCLILDESSERTINCYCKIKSIVKIQRTGCIISLEFPSFSLNILAYDLHIRGRLYDSLSGHQVGWY